MTAFMPHLLYIHGFLSSPQSAKAVQVGKWLAENRPEITFHCPFLTPYPDRTRTTLVDIVERHNNNGIALVGSSLGGFWSTWLVEKYNLRAVLINPAVDLEIFRNDHIGVELQNHHTDDTYFLTEEHVEHFRRVVTPVVNHHANYWLMVQTADETLDYRLAVDKYKFSRQLVEQGGDHSFQGFERHIPDVIEFLYK